MPAAQPPIEPSPYTIDLGATDIVDSEPPPAPRKRRRTVIVSGVAAVLIAAGGIGAYAGVRAWTGSGIVEPESAMPAATAAFLRVDLKPGYRDQLAFDGLAKKFPGHGESTTELVTRIERQMLTGTGLDYDTDVASWFGQRAGIGIYAGKNHQTTGLIALASNDDAKAKQALGKQVAAHPGKLGYVVRDGYVLIAVGGTDPQASAEAASAAAATANLADDSGFHDTVAKLPGRNLVVGYADLSKVRPLLAGAMPGVMVPGAMSLMAPGISGESLPGLRGTDASPAGGFPDALAKASGRIAVGASVADDGVEIHVHFDGDRTAAPSITNARLALDALPASTVVGMAARGLPAGSPELDQLDSMLSQLDAGAAGLADGAGPPPLAVPQLSDLLKDVLTAKMISIAFTGVSNGTPNVRILIDAATSAAADKTYQHIGLLGGMPNVSVTKDGTAVRAEIGSVADGGRLADSALYQEAMPGNGSGSVAAYLDVQKLLTAVPGPDNATAADLAPVKAIGLVSSQSGASSDMIVRIIIK